MRLNSRLAFGFLALLALSACVSGKPKQDVYVGKDGSTTVIESDAEMCSRSCNNSYARCMESSSAGVNNSGVNGPSGVYGASGECRGELSRCLKDCKRQ